MARTFNPRTSLDVVTQTAIGVLVNERVQELLGRYGSAPDPPRQGDTPSQPSRQQIAFYLLPGGGYWEEPRMGAKLAQPSHIAAWPRGGLIPDDERDNIARPGAGTVAQVPNYIGAPTIAPIPGE